jgi:NADH-quinone oxidoreductase subunit L
MVTAGVYLLARMFPLMELHPAALPTVAWVGGGTALLAATIGMAQYDFKRIWAYSTVSQLGYMFMGIGVLTTYGAAYHVFTHAFFKALLFLTAGAVMHGFAGQLDLRKVSGLARMKGWKIVAWTMFIGCLCLAGIPGTSGYFSKDAILAQAFVDSNYGFTWLGWIAIVTAGLTAYYTFRVWFRVCAGPVQFEMGDEQHSDDDHGHNGHSGHSGHNGHSGHSGHSGHNGHNGHDDHHGHGDHHGHDQPHPPRMAIRFVLLVLAIGAVLAAVPYFMANEAEHAHGGWVADMVADSSAAPGLPDHEAHGSILGFDPHIAMYFISGIVGFIGIAIAWWLHMANRAAADRVRATLLGNPATRWLPTAMENKWYVDEIYHAAIRAPLWILGHLLYILDQYLLDRGIIDGIARIPRGIARMFQPLHNGVLQSYAVSMVGGIGLITVLVMMLPQIRAMLSGLFGGGGG